MRPSLAAGLISRRCISTLPRILRTSADDRGEKFIESRPRCYPPLLQKRSQSTGARPSFQTDLYKSCLSLRALSGWATVLLPPPPPSSLLFMNLWKFIAKLGIGVVSFCFDGFGVPSAGSTRVGEVDEALLYLPGSLIRGILAGSSWNFVGWNDDLKIVARSSSKEELLLGSER